MEEVEGEVERLGAELEILREQSRMLVQRTSLGFLNQFYFRAGLSLIVPRVRTLPFKADTGLGAAIGAGQYFGRNHVVDLGFEWDFYPALSAQYRFEFHSDNPAVTFGPVVGVKIRAIEARPWDNFVDGGASIKTSFLFLGGILGFPIGRSLMTLQVLYLTNQQAFLVTNLGVHFFLL